MTADQAAEMFEKRFGQPCPAAVWRIEGLTPGDFAQAADRASLLGDYRLRRQRDACAAWTVGKAAPDFLAPIDSSAVVLLISGGLDPVTPPEWAEAVARSLPRARHLVIPASGHVFDGLSGIDTCFDPLVRKFLDTADLAALDPACLSTMRPPPFKVGPDSGPSARQPH